MGKGVEKGGSDKSEIVFSFTSILFCSTEGGSRDESSGKIDRYLIPRAFAAGIGALWAVGGTRAGADSVVTPWITTSSICFIKRLRALSRKRSRNDET